MNLMLRDWIYSPYWNKEKDFHSPPLYTTLIVVSLCSRLRNRWCPLNCYKERHVWNEIGERLFLHMMVRKEFSEQENGQNSITNCLGEEYFRQMANMKWDKYPEPGIYFRTRKEDDEEAPGRRDNEGERNTLKRWSGFIQSCIGHG